MYRYGINQVVPVLLLSTMPQRPMEGVEVYFHTFLTSALDAGEWSA